MQLSPASRQELIQMRDLCASNPNSRSCREYCTGNFASIIQKANQIKGSPDAYAVMGFARKFCAMPNCQQNCVNPFSLERNAPCVCTSPSSMQMRKNKK